MDLRFDYSWVDTHLRLSPEVQATWSSFALFANDRCLTQAVERRTKRSRSHLAIPLYDLAEWLAFNWFFITTPYAHVKSHSGARGSARFDLRKVGGGFPLPGIVFRAEADALHLAAQPRGGSHARVSLLAAGEETVWLDAATKALAGFVDEVVDRLRAKGVEGTGLEAEWHRVRSLSSDQEEFCRAAALLGLDPFAATTSEREALLSLGNLGLPKHLLFDLLPAFELEDAQAGASWVASQLPLLEHASPLAQELRDLRDVLGATDFGPTLVGARPWHLGWARASKVRSLLGVESEQPLEINDLVRVEISEDVAPGRVDALVEAAPEATVCVISAKRPKDARRFVAARTLARSLFEPNDAPQVIWHGSDYVFRAERAFAAELLAPATGVAEMLDGDFSAKSRRRVASHFGVSNLLIDHQIRNQLDAA